MHTYMCYITVIVPRVKYAFARLDPIRGFGIGFETVDFIFSDILTKYKACLTHSLAILS